MTIWFCLFCCFKRMHPRRCTDGEVCCCLLQLLENIFRHPFSEHYVLACTGVGCIAFQASFQASVSSLQSLGTSRELRLYPLQFACLVHGFYISGWLFMFAQDMEVLRCIFYKLERRRIGCLSPMSMRKEGNGEPCMILVDQCFGFPAVLWRGCAGFPCN